jgi:hypothetical protein
MSHLLIGLALGAATTTWSGCAVPGNLMPSGFTHSSPTTENKSTKNNTPPPAVAVEPTPMPPGAPVGQPVDMATYWDKDIQMVLDPVRHGERSPCLIGRLIMVDCHNNAICSDGTVTISLYNDLPAQGTEPVLLEQMQIDSDTLRKMIFKDRGLQLWGYTLGLPIATCPPGSLTKIHITVEFKPANGNPLYADTGSFKMKRPEVTCSHQTMMPSGPQGELRPMETSQAQQQPALPQLQFQAAH